MNKNSRIKKRAFMGSLGALQKTAFVVKRLVQKLNTERKLYSDKILSFSKQI